MYPMKNNCYELIMLIIFKFISLDILLQLLWNFYAMLWILLECSDNYFLIFGVLYLLNPCLKHIKCYMLMLVFSFGAKLVHSSSNM